MPAIWSELDRERWSWSERSLLKLRQEVEGMDGDVELARLAHVMVLGDTQMGKTTLLIRLLGVSDPERVEQAEAVLRAGRGKGRSATSASIRYRWSPDPRRWLLIRGGQQPELLTSEELVDVLGEFRSPDDEDTLRWRAHQRPLEIGLPTCLARTADRRELRVLDVPGLFARGAEQATAEAVVSRLIPVMNLVVFVLQVDNMAESFGNELIRDHPHLSAWTRSLDHYRVVLTRAFTNGTVKDLLDRLDPHDRTPACIAAKVREKLAEKLASTVPGGDARRLAQVVYPVEIGASWRELRDDDPERASLVGPANERLLGELRRSIEVRSSMEAYHLAAPEMALRIGELVTRRAEDRQAAWTQLEHQMGEYADELAEADRALSDRLHRRDAAARELEALRAAIGDLGSRRLPYQRPEPPAMDDGNVVRASQEGERQALHRAAQQLWSSWRSTTALGMRHCPFPTTMPLDEARLRDRYDAEVGCCQNCTGNWFSRWLSSYKGPDHCYLRMGLAGQAIRRWVPEELAAAAAKATEAAEINAERATEQYHATLRERDRCQRQVDHLRPRLDQLQHDHTEASRRDERDRASAKAVTTVLDRANKAYVGELFEKMAAVPPSDRCWYAIAVLRALLDLERMMGAA